MQPGQTFDPRDAWDRARRREIYLYAKENGIAEIVEQMPKDLMVARLKAMGLPPPSVPPRLIGAFVDPRSGDTNPTSHHNNGSVQPQPTETVEMDAMAVLEHDWKQQQAQPKPEMTFTEVRQECKRRGIKFLRTDKMVTLKAKLDGNKNAA